MIKIRIDARDEKPVAQITLDDAEDAARLMQMVEDGLPEGLDITWSSEAGELFWG